MGSKAPCYAAVNIYAWGACYLSCCATKTFDRDAVEHDVNKQHPTGVGPWTVSGENFKTGEPNPHQCEDDESRQHWLMSC